MASLARSVGFGKPRDEKIDFFISYASEDVRWARWAARVLEKHGYRTRYQERDFRPGLNFVHEMDEAIRLARRTLVLISPNYMESRWAALEWHAVLAKDPTHKKRLIIPLRVAQCEPDGLLRAIVYIDLVNKNDEECEQALLEAVSSARKRLFSSIRKAYDGWERRHAAKAEAPSISPSSWWIFAPVAFALLASFGLIGLGLDSDGGETGTGVRVREILQRWIGTASIDSQWDVASGRQPLDWVGPGLRLPQWLVRPEWISILGTVLYRPSFDARDGTVEFSVGFRRGVTMMARSSRDAARHYAVRLDRASPNQVNLLVSLVDGTRRTPFHRASRVPVELVQRNLLALEMERDHFQLRVNGSDVAEWRDDRLERGAAGLQASTADGVQVYGHAIRLSRAMTNGAPPVELAVLIR
jgi:hypothetical protein